MERWEDHGLFDRSFEKPTFQMRGPGLRDWLRALPQGCTADAVGEAARPGGRLDVCGGWTSAGTGRLRGQGFVES